MPPVGRPNVNNSYGPPDYPPPPFIPSISKAKAEGRTKVPGTGMICQYAIRNCKFKYTYIWLNNGLQFWTKPILINKNFIYCWIWNNLCWIYQKLAITDIHSFMCY
ncbi:hypothetical protein FQB35_05565 [Crassaminicella thermophila]|uniref:Uncharacterized protein n=1 Tax=Crassaminicella thermophila TaxID=2599308 RepID=A0A5C0SF66_CRATE|nr:hypothetical protein [Crassaminicella thermophila]QEK11878.1 hypothetical protein FQB35_05565 [Crassaminicella thermophila]